MIKALHTCQWQSCPCPMSAQASLQIRRLQQGLTGDTLHRDIYTTTMKHLQATMQLFSISRQRKLTVNSAFNFLAELCTKQGTVGLSWCLPGQLMLSTLMLQLPSDAAHSQCYTQPNRGLPCCEILMSAPYSRCNSSIYFSTYENRQYYNIIDSLFNVSSFSRYSQ